MKVRIILYDKKCLFEMKTEGSAGYDLKSRIDTIIKPGEIAKIPVGFAMELPMGKKADILPRSGLALTGIKVANAPGLCDSDYRDEYAVLLENTSSIPFKVFQYDRIAQMVITDYTIIQEIEIVEKLEKTTRNGGFGHTGISNNQTLIKDESLDILKNPNNAIYRDNETLVKNTFSKIKDDTLLKKENNKLFEIKFHKKQQPIYEECLLSNTILDKLGFSTYWDSNSSSEDRILRFEENLPDDTNRFIITDFDETNNINENHLDITVYGSSYFYNKHNYTRLYFVSDLIKSINESRLLNKYKKIFNDRIKSINLGHYLIDDNEMYHFICINTEKGNITSFNTDYYKARYDGVAFFYYTNEKWHFGLYSNNKFICEKIAKQYNGYGNNRLGFFELNQDRFNSIMKYMTKPI